MMVVVNVDVVEGVDVWRVGGRMRGLEVVKVEIVGVNGVDVEGRFWVVEVKRRRISVVVEMNGCDRGDVG